MPASATHDSDTPHDSNAPRGGREVVTLAEALDRLLYTGVAVEGQVAIGLADVELLFLDLRLLLGSVDTIWPDGRPPFQPMIPPAPSRPPSLSGPPADAAPRSPGSTSAALPQAQVIEASAPPRAAPPPPSAAVRDAPATETPDGSLVKALGAPPAMSSTADGLVRLVLTLVKLLHEVLERQAVRRMTAGSLSDMEVENIGSALFAQAVELERLRLQFGFSDGDLAINLGCPRDAA